MHYERMLAEILVPDQTWHRAELIAMVADGDLVPWYGGFVAWDFIETPGRRLELLRRVYRARGVPVGTTADWVKLGGRLPNEIVLQEPRRKPYC